MSGDRDNVVSLKPRAQIGRIPSSEFIVPTQDAKGHSARIGCRIPPQMLHQIEKIINSRKFPWDTNSDFMRWCIFRGQNEAGDILDDDRIDNTRAQINAMINILREEEEMATFNTVIDRTERVVSGMLAQGNHTPAKKLVKELLAQIEEISDAYWRRRYKTEVERRFGHIVNPAGKTSEEAAEDEDK